MEANLKLKLIQRIIEIDNVNLLKSIEFIFNTSDENILKFLNFSNENLQNQEMNETEDFSGYIKEWVKSM
ncbi:hypothetical protein [Lutibacter sp.]|uniref:hypothetical protein n=1 Tax=Lutibacter sp. TaxID=1925666 RepID=UPI00356704C6